MPATAPVAPPQSTTKEDRRARWPQKASKPRRHGPEPEAGESVVYDPAAERLDAFLERTKPSVLSRADNVAWICVRSAAADAPEAESAEVLQACQAEWRKLVRRSHPSVSDVDQLAAKHNVLSGKWMVFSSGPSVDPDWARIARAAFGGKLGFVAKVSSRDPEDEAGGHVIGVYTRDYSNREDVMRVRRALSDLGFTATLTYKPEIYTVLGIYPNNPHGLRPSVYSEAGYPSGATPAPAPAPVRPSLGGRREQHQQATFAPCRQPLPPDPKSHGFSDAYRLSRAASLSCRETSRAASPADGDSASRPKDAHKDTCNVPVAVA